MVTEVAFRAERLCNCQELVLLTILKGLHAFNCNEHFNTRDTFAFQQNTKTIPLINDFFLHKSVCGELSRGGSIIHRNTTKN